MIQNVSGKEIPEILCEVNFQGTLTESMFLKKMSRKREKTFSKKTKKRYMEDHPS